MLCHNLHVTLMKSKYVIIVDIYSDGVSMLTKQTLTMHILTEITRISQPKSNMLSLTDCAWDFQIDELSDTLSVSWLIYCCLWILHCKNKAAGCVDRNISGLYYRISWT